MERRERQNLNRTQNSQTGRRTRDDSESKDRTLDLSPWVRIGLLAKKPDVVFNNVFGHINVTNLCEGFKALDGSKAKGIDNISKSEYKRNLGKNLQDLVDRIHKGTYRPQVKREVMIPKANGKQRPIAISCFEDKLIEWAIGKILEAIFEPIFINTSYGFRPRRSAHDATKTNYYALKDNKRPFVVEIDLANFFNTVPHKGIMRFLQTRISDKRFLGLVARFLKGEIHHSTGEIKEQMIGTSQGSIMSPILANIYLHFVLDTWFIENQAKSENLIVRYADDAVFMFSKEVEAMEFLKSLRERLWQFGLTLNEDKTRIINFTKGRSTVFSFLGFTYFWAISKLKGWRKVPLFVKTEKERIIRKIHEYYHWIKKNRNSLPTKDLIDITNAKLQGHYNYFGYYCNRGKLWRYFAGVRWALYKWLNRRSQLKSMNWKEFCSMPLRRPPPVSALKQLGWNPYV